MTTIYEKSEAYGSAKLVYLALGDRSLIKDGVSDHGYYHSPDKDKNELWIRGDDENNNKVFTALISYDEPSDVEIDLMDDDWKRKVFEETLQGQIIDLGNKGHDDEEMNKKYWSNIFEILNDSLVKVDNKTFKEVYNALDGLTFYCRPVDFAMHEPTDDYIHTDYCT